jgi:hypothetical protein
LRAGFLYSAIASAFETETRRENMTTTETPQIDFDAIRGRIRLLGEVFGEAEIEALASLSDQELNDPSVAIDFAVKHGVSLDWLYLGDARGLLVETRRARAAKAKTAH